MVQGSRVYKFEELEEKLGKREQVKLANNTVAVRRDQNKIAIRLHYTDVVTLTRDGKYILKTGGWYSMTTKDRINGFSPACVSQKKGNWFINAVTPFFDGVTVDRVGNIIEA
jgi:hypothetical protein